jgi:hypothetical protein
VVEGVEVNRVRYKIYPFFRRTALVPPRQQARD